MLWEFKLSRILEYSRMIRRGHLSTMNDALLVHEFVQISTDQGDALIDFDTSRFNRLFDRLIEVENELNKRQSDKRTLLIPLLGHENPQVRINAAKATLAIAPARARATLEALSNQKYLDQSLDAGMSLRALDQGIFKPT